MTKTEMNSPSLSELAGPRPRYAPAGRLAGKACLIVGATSGIGRVTALRMAAEGASTVFVSGRRQTLGQGLAEELCRLETDGRFVATDITCETDLAMLTEKVMRRYSSWMPSSTMPGFRSGGRR